MDHIAHSIEEALEIARGASLMTSGSDSGFPVYIIPWGTHSQEPLVPFLCYTTSDLKQMWEQWITNHTHPNFRRAHVIRFLEVKVRR